MNATCKTCPMATPWTPASDGKPRILCHHVASMDGGGEPERYETWFCSEHPARQRDRLAAMFAAGILANGQADGPRMVADDAYLLADAMLAASLSPPSEGAPSEGGRESK